MIVNIINSKKINSLTLPAKVKGQFWLNDTDDKGKIRQLISVEAVDGIWIAKANKKVRIAVDEDSYVESCPLTDSLYLNLCVEGSDERIVLFTEPVDYTRQTLKKLVVSEGTVFSIGRVDGNNIVYDNAFVSSHHADLAFDGEKWSISDKDSRNGTYVNGHSVNNKVLNPGDMIYIMGLKIVVGSNYLALNNPDEKVKIKSSALSVYSNPTVEVKKDIDEIPEKTYFSRSPRLHREITNETITIDAPPQPQKIDSVPLALMLGPSLTMGMTSVSTGILAVTNTIANGGNMSQALPTLVMSVSMLLGTILWPILTKRYEKASKIKSEQKRQLKYLEYLNGIRDEICSISKEQEEILSENYCTQAECVDRIARRKSNLWERVIGQKDFLTLRVGIGELPVAMDIKYQEKKFTLDDDSLQNAMLSLAEEPKKLANVPISVSFTDNMAIGLFGDKFATSSMLKSWILQMTALHSYDELKIMLITDEQGSDSWSFVKYIPHFWNDDKTFRFFASSANEVKELSAYIEKSILVRTDKNNSSYQEYSPYYVIISTSARLNKKCEAIKSLLKYQNNVGFTVVMLDERFDAFPKETKTVIHVNGDQSKIFDRDNTTGEQIAFAADKVDEDLIARIADKLATIELDNNTQKYLLPTMLTFLEMFNVGKVEHLNSLTRWKENDPTKTLQTPVGVDEDGDIFNLDLHEKFHGPHGLVAGMTGSGKSEFIITYILSLAVNYHPDEVAFILIDYKGGGLTGAFEDSERGIKLPHLAGTITNLDGASIKRSLTSIQSELRRRQALFNTARRISNEGTMDIYKYQQLYRDKVVAEPLPHLFIISDEFAELKTQQPEFMEQLISTARIGRSLGVHLILATQKPSGVVDDQIWSNSKFRVCLKVQDRSDSQDMIKCSDAAELSQTGRFYLQVGFNEFFALGQSAWCGAEYIPTDITEKTIDRSVQVIDNIGRVVMNVKPQSAARAKDKQTKQIVAIVKYLCDLANEESVGSKALWLDPIPARIFIDALEEKYAVADSGTTLNPVVGEYDDPFNQKQGVLTIPFSSEGNCLIYGATGNGKTTFLTTLCYSLIKHHTAKELNLYILDFGSETLKAFSKAPQVGGIITSADEEKTINFLKMLRKEIEHRKSLFAPFGGDYQSYCKAVGEPLPNIVVALNNFSGFAEQYEDLLEDFTILTRDCIKYGIYFAVTAGSTNAVRYKIQQNFKMMLTMQLNDATDYSLIVGRTDGLIPAKHKGRGLVSLDKPYEFQTAYCADVSDPLEYIRTFCNDLASKSDTFAKEIPVLPEVVDIEFMEKRITTLKAVPVGVAKQSLEIVTFNLGNKVIMPVVAQEIEQCTAFALAFSEIMAKIGHTSILDVEKLLGAESENAEEFVVSIFNEMVLRNNTYKDANLDATSLDAFEEQSYMIVGFKKLFDQLSKDGQDKLRTLLEKAEPIYKMHFVIVESVSNLNTFNYDGWYKRHVANGDGVYIGDGVADQYVLKINKITSNLYDEVGDAYGYEIHKGKPTLIKLLTGQKEEQ